MPALWNDSRQNRFGAHAGFDHQLRAGFKPARYGRQKRYDAGMVQIAEAVAETERSIECRPFPHGTSNKRAPGLTSKVFSRKLTSAKVRAGVMAFVQNSTAGP